MARAHLRLVKGAACAAPPAPLRFKARRSSTSFRAPLNLNDVRWFTILASASPRSSSSHPDFWSHDECLSGGNRKYASSVGVAEQKSKVRKDIEDPGQNRPSKFNLSFH
ncbi:hypothetical protein C8R45DRAFT_1093980 [Mycena sanguinolenta]|nr:hypothetical protein C8R45DRAFT_1093980 [Mycena sanguinolenta]